MAKQHQDLLVLVCFAKKATVQPGLSAAAGGFPPGWEVLVV